MLCRFKCLASNELFRGKSDTFQKLSILKLSYEVPDYELNYFCIVNMKYIIYVLCAILIFYKYCFVFYHFKSNKKIFWFHDFSKKM